LARLTIVSYRVPLPRDRALRAGGLAVGVADALRHRGGLWFGWSGEVTDQTVDAPRLEQSHDVTYAALDIGRDDYHGFYAGYANSTLWPLLHFRLGLLDFRREDFDAYRRVNEAFARALLPLLRPSDLVWVHDYQLIPLGAALRRLGCGNRIGFFLHVPCPPPAVFAALPQAETLLRGLTAYDLVGVQTANDLQALTDCLRAFCGLEADGAGVIRSGRSALRLGAFPIGIDTAGFAELAARAAGDAQTNRMRKSLEGRDLIIGVDRLDYTKGLPNKFEAYGRLLARFPQHRGRVTFLQIASRSRAEMEQYRALKRELDGLVGRINGTYAEFHWVPLRYITRPMPRTALAGLYRQAAVALVTPLRDGMNIVAKEYMAAQDPDRPGVLVLSRFAGAAQQLPEALIVNPYDPDEMAEALDAALGMEREQRQSRWRAVFDRLSVHTAEAWSDDFLALLAGSTS